MKTLIVTIFNTFIYGLSTAGNSMTNFIAIALHRSKTTKTRSTIKNPRMCIKYKLPHLNDFVPKNLERNLNDHVSKNLEREIVGFWYTIV